MATKAFLMTAVLALSACAGTAPAPIAGTAWKLHAIQSMDDAQGTTRVTDPKMFTLRFNTDGRATLRLDCNRGSGTWTAVRSSETTGSLAFGPLAVTRALCPPPNLGERIARDLPHVRSYTFKDGNLFMALMADGGIYEWRPDTD
ncbi:MAG: META domain-containing protein [Rhodospirillales bacterium]